MKIKRKKLKRKKRAMNRFPITKNVIFIFISFLYFMYTIFLSIMAPKVFCYCFEIFYVFLHCWNEIQRFSIHLLKYCYIFLLLFHFIFLSILMVNLFKKKCWKTTMWMYRYRYTAIEMWLVLRASISSSDKCMMWCDWVWEGRRRENKFTIVVMSRVYVKALNYVFL